MAHHVSEPACARVREPAALPSLTRACVASRACSASNALTGEGIEEGVSWLAENVVKAAKASKKSKK